MRRLYLVAEGETEEKLSKRLLGPHLLTRNVEVIPIVVETSRDERQRKRKGGGDWSKWRKELQKVLGEHRGGEEVVTTWFDLYGLPRGFPGLDQFGQDRDTVRRASELENALAREFNAPQFIPNLQRHETEALVFVDLDRLELLLLDDPDAKAGLEALRTEVRGKNPEDIDDGENTAPSKRLESRIPGYRKIIHGVPTIEAIGLGPLRARCPRFDAWVKRLELLDPGQRDEQPA